MAYGTPGSLDEVEAYYTDIRHGRKPEPELVKELTEKYRKIGGKSPLLEITIAQARALEGLLAGRGVDARVYVGMKHWHPYIKEVVPQILQNGHRGITSLVMAPHYSAVSILGYKQALTRAIGSSQVSVDFIESWYDNPMFHQAVAEKIKETLRGFSSSSQMRIVFTAHSLPEGILQNWDPYPTQLKDSCEAVAEIMGLDHWLFAYQSAGRTNEKWLGPDLLERLKEIGKETPGANVLVVPIGFVADHLEVLYDIDIEAKEFARKLGLTLRRTESLNTSPTFIEALAETIQNHLAGSGERHRIT